MTRYLLDSDRYRLVGPSAAVQEYGQRLASHPDSRTTECPCHGDRDSVVTEVDRYGLPCRLVICLECGLIRMNPAPTSSELEWFYRHVYRAMYGPHEPTNDRLFESKTWKGELALTALTRAGVRIEGREVVDIGCGAGWTLSAFGRAASRVGYDYDEALLDLGRGRGFDLRRGGVEQALADRRAFDIVICGHVLEHTPDPVEMLGALRALLTDDGFVYLELPHLRRIAARLGCDALRYWQRAHLWDFDLEHVVALGKRAGLERVWAGANRDSFFLVAARSEPAPEARVPRLGSEIAARLRTYERARSRPLHRTLRATTERIKHWLVRT